RGRPVCLAHGRDRRLALRPIHHRQPPRAVVTAGHAGVSAAHATTPLGGAAMAHPALPLPTAPAPAGSGDTTGTVPVEAAVAVIPTPKLAAQPAVDTDPDTGEFAHEDTGGHRAAAFFAGLIAVLALVLVVAAGPVVVRLVAGTV